MTDKDKWLTGGAIVLGGIILYLLLHKAGAIAPGWGLNFPPFNPSPIPPPVEYTVNASFPVQAQPSPCQPTCGCSGGGLFASISDMLTKLTGEQAAIEESYFAGIIASLPPWFSQNLNNVEGAYASGASINAFMSA